MSDNHVDVVLVTDDPLLVKLISGTRSPEATLLCLTASDAKDSELPSASEYWLDLDSGIAPGNRAYARRVYFCTTLPPRLEALPTALLLRKPCTAAVISVLWAGVVPAATRSQPTASDRDRSLPGWLFEALHLDLRRFCESCSRVLPEKLGYREITLYLYDADQNLLTVAESSSRRQIDLAVPLTPGNDHPLAVAACSGKRLTTDDLAKTCRLRGLRPLPGHTTEPGEPAMIVPLTTPDGLQGLLQLSGRSTTDVVGTELPLDGIFEFLARCLEHARRYLQARVEARVDRLTGLFNYRWMTETLEQEIHRSQRYRNPLALIMIDLDGLKTVNDRFGHLGGDALLRHTAGKVSAALRQIDLAARIGGDEFVVLLPGTDLGGARHVAQRILAAIRVDAPLINGQPVPIVASFGVAQWEQGWDERQLLAAADQAMYAAKRQGHNRLVCHHRRRAAKRSPVRQVH